MIMKSRYRAPYIFLALTLVLFIGCKSPAERLYEEADELEDKEQYEESLSVLKKSLEHDPEFVRAYIKMGRIYSTLKKYEKAEQVLHKAIDIDPGHYDAYKRLSEVYRKQKKLSQALGICQEALDRKDIIRDQKLKEKIERERFEVKKAIYKQRAKNKQKSEK